MTPCTRSTLPAALALALLGGCAAPPTGGGPGFALVAGYRQDSYNPSHPEAGRVRLLQIDHRPAPNPFGPVRVSPGRHELLVACAYRRQWLAASDAAVSLTLEAGAGVAYRLYPVAQGRDGATTCRVAISSSGPRHD